MRLYPFSFRKVFFVEVDSFGIYVVAGQRELFWQFGLGMKNLALCTAKDRELFVIG